MRVEIIKSSGELVSYADQWEALRLAVGGTIYASYPLTKLWLDIYSSSASPRIMVIEDRGEVVGIAPLVSTRLSSKGLSFRVLSLVGGAQQRLRLASNGILFAPGRQDVLELMVGEIRNLDWNLLWTINMDDNPSVRQYMEGVRSGLRAVEQAPRINLNVPIRPSGDVSEGFDRNARRNLRRTLRMLEREGRSFRLRQVAVDDVPRFVDVYARQHIERWGTKGGSYFRFPENCQFLKRVTHHACENGYGFAYELLIDDEVAAQLIGFQEGEVAYSYRLGMNDAFKRYNPGWLVCYHGLSALRERGVRCCNMGGGGERYKYEMGGQESLLVGIGASRGVASLIAHIVRSSTVQYLDSKLGMFNGMGISMAEDTMEGEKAPLKATSGLIP